MPPCLYPRIIPQLAVNVWLQLEDTGQRWGGFTDLISPFTHQQGSWPEPPLCHGRRRAARCDRRLVCRLDGLAGTRVGGLRARQDTGCSRGCRDAPAAGPGVSSSRGYASATSPCADLRAAVSCGAAAAAILSWSS